MCFIKQEILLPLHHVKGWYISTWYSRYKKMLMTCSIPRPVRLERADLEVMLCTLKQQLDLFVPVRSITAHAGKKANLLSRCSCFWGLIWVFKEQCNSLVGNKLFFPGYNCKINVWSTMKCCRRHSCNVASRSVDGLFYIFCWKKATQSNI